MAMSLADFRIRFPEFKTVSDAMVTAYLSDADLSIDATYFDSNAQIAGAYLAAHRLALSPYGSGAKLANDKGQAAFTDPYDLTTYGKHFKSLRDVLGLGCQVIT